MTSEREFLERVRERQLAEVERMDGGRKRYWRAPLVVAVLAWALFLGLTFLVAVGSVAMWSGAHVFGSAVFLIVGVMAGAINVERPPSPNPSRREGGRSR